MWDVPQKLPAKGVPLWNISIKEGQGIEDAYLKNLIQKGKLESRLPLQEAP